MTRYGARYLAGGTTSFGEHDFLCGLGGGYFANVYQVSTSPSEIELRHISDPDIILDSSASYSGLTYMAGYTGEVYAVQRTAAGPGATVYHVTNSGPTLTLGSVGTYSLAATFSRPSHPYIHGGGAQMVSYCGEDATLNYWIGINTSTGAYDFHTSVNKTAHVIGFTGPARVDRFLMSCDTDTAFELRDDTGALMSSVALTGMSPYDLIFAPLPGDRTAVFDATNSLWGVLDCSTDTLAWESGPTSVSGFGGVFPPMVAWGDLILIGPHGNPSATTAAGLSTGALSNSMTFAADDAIPSSRYNCFAGASGFARVSASIETFTVGPLGSYLRQRQSPVRTPSRVRPPQVRQRQRPEATT